MKEIRMNFGDVAFRDEEGSREIYGHALVFNQESNDLGGFTERIDPQALDGVLENSDVFCYYNHNPEHGILARCNKGEGTLELFVDEVGLGFRYTAPNTTLGNDVLEMVRRGDLTDNSFAFTCESDTWEHRADGTYLRTINKIGRLYDISQVVRGAYSQPEVNTRGLDDLKEQEQRDAEEAQKKIAEQEAYIKGLRDEIK